MSSSTQEDEAEALDYLPTATTNFLKTTGPKLAIIADQSRKAKEHEEYTHELREHEKAVLSSRVRRKASMAGRFTSKPSLPTIDMTNSYSINLSKRGSVFGILMSELFLNEEDAVLDNLKKTRADNLKKRGMVLDEALDETKTEKNCNTEREESEYDEVEEKICDNDILKREKLKFSEKVRTYVKLIWVTASALVPDPNEPSVSLNVMYKEQYIIFCKKLRLVLFGKLSKYNSETVVQDWESDSEGAQYIDFECFFLSFFYLMDRWTQSIDENHYCDLINEIVQRTIVASSIESSPFQSYLKFRDDEDIIPRETFRQMKSSSQWEPIYLPASAEELSRHYHVRSIDNYDSYKISPKTKFIANLSNNIRKTNQKVNKK